MAVKISDTRKLKEDYQRKNMHREATILSQLRHPNIVRVYESLKVGAAKFEGRAEITIVT